MPENIIPGLNALDPAVIDAFVKTNRTAMRGFERLSQYFFETARQNFETAIETSKRLAQVKSLPELAELQTKLSQEFFDTIAVRNKTAADLGSALMEDTAAPGAVMAKSMASSGDTRRNQSSRVS